MTEAKKDIVRLLLQGWYLKPWKNHIKKQTTFLK